MAPPIAGLTDQVREPPLGRLGVNTAVNVVVDPAATVIEEGFTDTLKEEGLGLGKPLLLTPLPPQPVSPRMIKGSARLMEKSSISDLGFGKVSIVGLVVDCGMTTQPKQSVDQSLSSVILASFL